MKGIYTGNIYKLCVSGHFEISLFDITRVKCVYLPSEFYESVILQTMAIKLLITT